MNIIDNCAYKIIFDSEKGTGSTRLKQTISQLNSVIKKRYGLWTWKNTFTDKSNSSPEKLRDVLKVTPV